MEIKKLNKREAIEFAESGAWKDMSLDVMFHFQLYQPLLCMPFDKFHEAAEHALGRPVFTHEFAFWDRMVAEYEGRTDKPTLEDILALIPEDKLIMVSTP